LTEAAQTKRLELTLKSNLNRKKKREEVGAIMHLDQTQITAIKKLPQFQLKKVPFPRNQLQLQPMTSLIL
jgi:hypothetical protein